jgi:hypothetical protein
MRDVMRDENWLERESVDLGGYCTRCYFVIMAWGGGKG